MSEPNPYEAPRHELSQGASRFNRLIATRMLEVRNRGGYTLWLYLRWNWPNYLFLLVSFVVSLLIDGARRWELPLILLGMIPGFLLRDCLWLQSSQQAWPFTTSVTDWGRVQKVAGGGPLD